MVIAFSDEGRLSDNHIVDDESREPETVAETGEAQLPWEENGEEVTPVTVATAPSAPASDGSRDNSPAMVAPLDATSEPASSTSIWTIPLLCLGIGLIACCLVIPAADDNRQLAYEKERLKRDLEYVNEQVRVNDAFLHKLAGDPALAERLATRQMKLVREGANVLQLTGLSHENLTPFELVIVPPPEPLPPYQPLGGKIAALCRHPKSKLYTIGAGLMAIAVGLVLGSAPHEGPRRP